MPKFVQYQVPDVLNTTLLRVENGIMKNNWEQSPLPLSDFCNLKKIAVLTPFEKNFAPF